MSDEKKGLLANTFFDFGANPETITKPIETKVITKTEDKEDDKTKTEDKIAAQQVIDDAAAAKKVEDEESSKKKKEDESKVEYTKEEFDDLATTLKAKKEEDLKDDEKQFLIDYKDDKLSDYKKETVKKDAEGFIKLAKNLVEAGIIDDSEDLKDTQESFNEVITSTIDSRVDTKVDEYLAEIPEDYKNVIDHFRSGGNINEYLQSKATIDYKSLDLDNVSVQKALVEADLRQQEYSEEDIIEKVKDYEDLEKLKKEATKASNKFDRDQTTRIKAYDKSIVDDTKKQDKADLEDIKEVKKLIDDMDEIVGFKLDKKRKKAFKDYLFVVDNNGETAATRSQKDNKNRIKAHFMSFIEFNFKDLEKTVTTKQTKSLSELLSRYKDSATVSKGTVVKDLNPDDNKEKPFVFNSMFDQAPDD